MLVSDQRAVADHGAASGTEKVIDGRFRRSTSQFRILRAHPRKTGLCRFDLVSRDGPLRVFAHLRNTWVLEVVSGRRYLGLVGYSDACEVVI